MKRSHNSSEPLFQRADGTLMVREPDGRSRIATVTESAAWSAAAPKPGWWRRLSPLIREAAYRRRRATIRRSSAELDRHRGDDGRGDGEGDRDDGNECRARPHHGEQHEAEDVVRYRP